MANNVKAAEGAQTSATKGDEKTADNAGQTQTKVGRRGLGTARGATRLKFTHENAQSNGLFHGGLRSVEVSNIAIGESSSGMPSFNGMEIPRIVLTFTSPDPDVAKRRYVPMSFTAVESNVETIPGGKSDWKVNAIFDMFKHILDVYVFKHREPTEEELAQLSLPFEDFDEQGEYVPVDAEEVAAGWRVLFENFANMLNNGKDDKPVYLNAKGEPINIWMKLLRHIKNTKKKVWTNVTNGDLAFPTFVGEGVIEIWKANTKPVLRIDALKESIHPMDIDKAKAPTSTSGIPAMGGGVPIDGGQFGNNDFGAISTEGNDDMPF